MANDLFGGLGGFMIGFSNFMPQDDPDVKLLNTQSQLNQLQQEETMLYAEIGRQALAQMSGQFPEQEARLTLVKANIADAQAKLNAAQEEKKRKEQEQRRIDEQCTCPECGHRNAEGIKFCQECGAKLGIISACPACGAKLVPGVRFCGECGARLEG